MIHKYMYNNNLLFHALFYPMSQNINHNFSIISKKYQKKSIKQIFVHSFPFNKYNKSERQKSDFSVVVKSEHTKINVCKHT